MFCLFSFLLYIVPFYFLGGFWLGILDFLKDFLGYFLIQRCGLCSWLSLCFCFLVNGSLVEHRRQWRAEDFNSCLSPDHCCFLLMSPVAPDGAFIPSHLLTSITKQLVLIFCLCFFYVILSFLHLVRGAYDGIVTELNSYWRCVL